MKDQKRFAALALSAVMVFSMAGSVSAAQKVESKDDLAGATIGVQLGTTGDLDASDYEKDGSTVERYSKGSEAVQALKAGQIDCVIIDSQPAQKFAENNDDLKILDEPFEEEEYAICLKKGNDELLDKINGALKEMKEDGTIDSIMDNYIGEDAGKTPYESPIGPVGGKLPIVMGTSSGFIGVCQSVAGVMGNGVVAYGAIMAASFIGGLFETVLGSFLKPLRKFFPSVVTGTVVLSIGLSLIAVGISSFGGGSSAKDYGSLENLFVGFVVLVVIVVLKHGTKGFTSFASILIGIIVGYVLVSIMAAVLPTTFTYVDDAGATVEATKSWVLNWDKVASASWFAVPKIMPVKWVFDARAIVPICIMFIVTAVETVGDISGITEGGLGREATDKELSGGVMCDGLGSSLAAVFGVLPNTSFSQNVGLVAMNKVVNRFSIATGGIFLIACGLFPKLAALISIMPQSVLGGAAVMMFSSIVVSGIQLITKWPVTPRNVTIVSVALGLGYGLGANSAVLAHMPQAITLIFGGSGIVPAALFAIILNIVLPPDEKSEVEIAEEILDMKKKEAQKK